LLNCGLCGAPSRKDQASGRSEISDCVFLSKNRIDQLRRIYKKGPRPKKSWVRLPYRSVLTNDRLLTRPAVSLKPVTPAAGLLRNRTVSAHS